MGLEDKKIHIGYAIRPIDADNYEILAKFFDDNQNLLKEVSKEVPMKDFNNLLVYTDEEFAIKAKAEEIVKTSMYKAMVSLLETDIRIASTLLTMTRP
jgi:hypothetical protein